MTAPLHHPVIPAAERQEIATHHVIEVWASGCWVRDGRPHDSRAAALAAIAADTWLVRLPADDRRVREIQAATSADIYLDLDLPDGMYDGLDILTAAALNHERKALADAALDGRADRLLQAMEGD
jgi:hypothetical protein